MLSQFRKAMSGVRTSLPPSSFRSILLILVLAASDRDRLTDPLRTPSFSPNDSQQLRVEAADLNISLAVIHHPFEVHPVSEKVSSVLRSFAAGEQGIEFHRVTVFYDGRKQGAQLEQFLKQLDVLKKRGLIQQYVELRFDDLAIRQAYNGTLANVESGRIDPASVAFYQHIFEECATVLCMQMEGDVWAHYGGGIRLTATRLLREQNHMFMVPPRFGKTFTRVALNSSLLLSWFEGKPYPFRVAPVPRLALGSPKSTLDQCWVTGPDMTTRYFMVHRLRILERGLFPMRLPPNGIFEQGIMNGAIHCPEGTGVGWMIHPPLFELGRQLEAACSVASFQNMVDDPEGLLVDEESNMVLESWGTACNQHIPNEHLVAIHQQ